MAYRFHHRCYRLRLRGAVRTAHGAFTEREGVLVRLEAEGGRVGWGEATPIEWFGTESASELAAACAPWEGASLDRADIAGVPPRLSCLRSALTAALAELDDSAEPTIEGSSYRSVAALLPAGRPALGQVRDRAEAGFRVFKWKVGVGDPGDELALLDDLCASLPEGARLRLDANGAWDRRLAERWLALCSERPVEFVEQPIASDARGVEDLLLGLAREYPTALALDESLVRDGDVERWVALGWPGVYVLKPALLGDTAGALDRLRAAKARVVFSSSLETALGARSALRHAFAWTGERLALGFGVWPLFADARFDGPAAAPFLYWQDVERISPEAVWNALG